MSLVVAVMLGLSGLVQGVQVAHAAEINPIVPGSVKLADKSSPAGPTYVWNDVELSGRWAIDDYSGQEGDTFTIGLPAAFEGTSGTFELVGSAQNPIDYGTCVVSRSEVSCTLNSNVVGKVDVGGEFFINTRVAATHTGDTATLLINGGTPIEVALPNGQTDIGYSPYVPDDISKAGFFLGDPYDTLAWKIRIPGQELSGNTLTIDDTFTVPGSTLTVKPAEVTLYRIPNHNPLCWNETSRADCRTVLYSNDGGNYPDVIANIDDTSRIQLTYTKAEEFSEDDMYLLEYSLSVGEEILVGAQYPNTVTINGNSYEAAAVREAAGGGTGAGGNDTVGHVSVGKAVVNDVAGAVPADTVFPVDYSYTVKGRVRTGTLALRADGTLESLYNIPNGTVVTLTEKVPAVAGVTFGDPVFAGDGVSDGVPDATSAQVRVEGSTTLVVRLTNTLVSDAKPALSRVEVTPGVCAPGATEPSEPTVEVAPTDGITYSAPEITKDGKQVTVKVTATPAAGRTIDGGNLPEGWVANGDGSFTFTKTITQPDCAAVPVVPDVKPGVCPVDSATPTQPTVSGVEDTDSIDYGEPVFGTNGNEVTVTVTATPRNGSRIDVAKLPEGWSVVDGVVTYTSTITQPRCVVPVVPTVDVGSCPVGATTPTAPSASIDEVEGLEFSEPRIEVRDGKVSVSAAATAKAGYQIGGPLPEGWTRVNETSATFTTVKDQPSCDAPTPTPTPSPSVSLTPDPSPSPVPSSSVPVPGVTVTPTVPVPVPTPVRPGLPKTGA